MLVAYDPKVLPFEQLLKTFWEGHDPTQGMRQGNDMGTQYRSALYWTTDAQREIALRSRDAYQAALSERGRGQITTELPRPARSTRPRTTTSSTCRRTPAATAASAARA